MLVTDKNLCTKLAMWCRRSPEIHHQMITLRDVSFHFYRWNQFKVLHLECTLRTRNLPKFSATSDAGCIFTNARRFGIVL